VDLRHLPEGTHSLAPRPGSLVRLAFQKWPAEPKLDRAKVGPRGRCCTCNLPGLSGTPLLLGYTRLASQAEALAKAGAPGQDCTDTKRGLSPLPLPWATGAEMVLALRTREPAVRPRASLSPDRDPQRPISAQTNWCRVRDLASQARHKMDAQQRTFVIANRGPPPTSPS
jgi:hypothetical protein